MSSNSDPAPRLPEQEAYRKRVITAVVILAVLLVGGCCGSCGLFAFSLVSDAIEQVKGNRIIQQELGDVRDVQLDQEAQLKLPEEEKKKGTVLVFKAIGTDGTAQVVVELGPEGVKLKRMIMEDGREILFESDKEESNDHVSEAASPNEESREGRQLGEEDDPNRHVDPDLDVKEAGAFGFG